MKSYNHIQLHFKACSSMKVSRLYISIIYEFNYRSLSLTALSAVPQEVVSVTVSPIMLIIAYNIMALIVIFIIIRMYLLTNLLMIPMRFHVPRIQMRMHN